MFAANEIEYLGHTLTVKGVRPNSRKVEAVKCFSRPATTEKIKISKSKTC